MSAEANAGSNIGTTAPGGARVCWTSARDGLRLAWTEHAPAAPAGSENGTDIICLAGMTRNARDFSDIAQWLAARGRRVICPDYRGRGLSAYDPNPANYRVETYLDDLRAVLTAAGVHRAVVIGTSLGGIMAMAMGVVTPTVLAGALINDIGPEIKMDTLDGVAAHIRAGRTFSNWDEAAGYLREAFPELPAHNDEEWLTAVRATYREGRDGRIAFDYDPAVAHALNNPNRPETIDIWRFYNSLARIPLAVVRGADSRIFPAELMERMADRRPGGLISAVIENVGHAPSLNEPKSREAVQELLAATG
ncbi:MAG: alpha/beta fold hydrolase [Rhodospirillales bacterium]